MVCLEMAGGPTNIKNTDLNRMYNAHKDFDPKSSAGRAVVRTLNLLAEVFPDKTPELERFNVISLYCVTAEVLKQYVIEDVKPHLRDWFLTFEEARRIEEAKSEDDADAEWVIYRERISHSTDAADSIRWRMEFMLKSLLGQQPGIRLKDNQRAFTHVQKVTVFRRDKGMCQLKRVCSGEQLTWDAWHCDHRQAWSQGGATTVENGQVACGACNLAKGAEVA